MSLMLLHLSDLHISDNWLPPPAEKVVAALREVHEKVEAAVILISGDIASTGELSQYQAATEFIRAIKEGMQREFDVGIHIIVVPGNHDCFFPEDSSLRDLVIEKTRSVDGIVDSGQMMRACLSVQDEFFTWLANLTNQAELDDSERLCWIEQFDLPSNRRVAVLCLNTAWISTLHEEQGKLVFPISRLPEPPNADIVISIFHHPYNWLRAKNARDLRNTLQASCDIIITGHEHDPGAYVVVQKDNASIEYIEGHIMGNPNKKGDYGFNVILIDLDKSLYQVRHYTWNSTLFLQQTPGTESTVFTRNAHRRGAILALSDNMTAFLRDPGAPLTHHGKAVELEDIFVTPNLRRFTNRIEQEVLHREILYSDYVINKNFDEKYVYYSGESQCGKTSLAKILFQQALHRSLTPVLLDGASLKSPEPRSLVNLIGKMLSNQYKNLTDSAFMQLPKEKKVIIVDDFGEVTLNRAGKTAICQWLKEQHGYVFLMGGNLLQLEEFILDKEAAIALSGYVYYGIMELGFLLREKLTKKWLTIGRPYALENDHLTHLVAQATRIVDTILGKNLLPSYPIFVLSILQQIEAQQPLNTKTGAYGYFYEVLITTALHQTSQSIDDIDMKYTYLSELAWYLFTKGQRELDADELALFGAEHWRKYRLPNSADPVNLELENSRILLFQDGKVRFAYRYIYYYFVARYMRDNLLQEDVQKTIDDVVNNLHRDDCANVIIFLTYLSKDKEIIGRVLKTSRKFFKDTDPCDMKTHIEFINRLQERVPKIILPEGDVDEHREKFLREKDRAQIGEKGNENKGQGSDTDNEEALEDLLGMNRALKSVQIMGQILRNFSGSLPGDIKVELAKECFATALRALSVILNALEMNLEAAVKIFTEVFDKAMKDMAPEEKEAVARETIFFLTVALCFGIIKRISLAVGSERLAPTYDDVKQIYDNTATEFVQTTIRLDHDRYFPEKRIMELKKSLGKNIFGETLLRILVAEHFYLFPRPFRTRQRMCAHLGIEPKQKMLLPGPTRKRKK